ncbi:MAG: hypothetical protein ACR2HN_10695 [Tepidiformaceae bacterium]
MTRPLRTLAFVVLCGLSVSAAASACEDQSDPGSIEGATATPEAPLPEASPTPKAIVVPEPTPATPWYQFYPPGTLTSTPAVDAILDAHYRGDVEAIYQLLDFQRIPCTAVFLLDWRIPRCRAGEPAGTPVPSLAFGCPEGRAWRDDEVREVLSPLPPLLHAAYRIADGPLPQGIPPGTRYVVALGDPVDGLLHVYIVKEPGGISELQYYCGSALGLDGLAEPILAAKGINGD